MRRLPKAVALFLLASTVPAQAEILDGMWNLTLTMQVDGTAQPFGPFSQNHCFNQADTQDPGKLFGESAATCEYANKRYYANKFTFNIRCSGGIPLSGMGEVEFSKDHFEGHMDLVAKTEDELGVETHSQVSGRRTGPCQK